jgi:hypothetical protein
VARGYEHPSGISTLFSVSTEMTEKVNILFADFDLARRVEAAEAQASLDWLRAYQRLHPAAGGVAETVAGGHAVFAGISSPVTEVKGLGMNGPVSESDLDRIEDVYRSRGSACQVVVCPMAEPSLFASLGRRDYRLAEMENVLVRRLEPSERVAPEVPNVTVRRATQRESDLWVEIMGRGFFEQGLPDPKLMDMLRSSATCLEAQCFLGFLGDEPAGAGVLFMHQAVALLSGAATLPRFRKLGVHKALHYTRLACAAAEGCDLALVVTQPGCTSQRNAERQGFQVAYTRAKLVRAFA